MAQIHMKKLNFEVSKVGTDSHEKLNFEVGKVGTASHLSPSLVTLDTEPTNTHISLNLSNRSDKTPGCTTQPSKYPLRLGFVCTVQLTIIIL